MVVRPGHPLTKGRITKQRLFEFPHVVVEMIGAEEHEQRGFFWMKQEFPDALGSNGLRAGISRQACQPGRLGGDFVCRIMLPLLLRWR